MNVGEMISSGGMGDFRGAESPVVSVEIEGVASPLYVFFGKNSSSLSQKDRASIGEMASDASKAGYRLYVRGFSGTSGGVEMVKNRAKTVYDALRKYGADAVLPSEYAFVADDLTPALSDDCVIISFR